MKFSKASLGVLGIGSFVIIGAGIGLFAVQQERDQGALREQLNATNARIASITPVPGRDAIITQKNDLDASQAKLRDQLKIATDSLRTSVESIEATNTLYKVARETNVSVLSLTATQPQVSSMAGVDLSSALFTATVEGNVPDLVTFISSFSNQFVTGTVESAEISATPKDTKEDGSSVTPVPTPTPTPTAAPAPEQKGPSSKPKATLVLRVYSYYDR